MRVAVNSIEPKHFFQILTYSALSTSNVLLVRGIDEEMGLNRFEGVKFDKFIYIPILGNVRAGCGSSKFLSIIKNPIRISFFADSGLF